MVVTAVGVGGGGGASAGEGYDGPSRDNVEGTKPCISFTQRVTQLGI